MARRSGLTPRPANGGNVGKGGYNGGSTIIRPGGGWSFDPEFDFKAHDQKPAKSEPGHFIPLRKPKRSKPKTIIAGTEVTKKERNKHRMAKQQGLDRDAILADLGYALPKPLPMRQVELKLLVAAKILLPTGAINVGHPEVAAWISKNGKKKKSNV